MNGREAMGRLAQRVKASMGRYRLVWLVILAGLILLLLPTGEKEGEAREETEQTQSAFDLAATEARLSQALSKIHGAGEVTVVLTPADPGGECGPGRVPGGGEDGDRGPLPGQRQPGDRHRPGNLPPVSGRFAGLRRGR